MKCRASINLGFEMYHGVQKVLLLALRCHTSRIVRTGLQGFISQSQAFRRLPVRETSASIGARKIGTKFFSYIQFSLFFVFYQALSSPVGCRRERSAPSSTLLGTAFSTIAEKGHFQSEFSSKRRNFPRSSNFSPPRDRIFVNDLQKKQSSVSSGRSGQQIEVARH